MRGKFLQGRCRSMSLPKYFMARMLTRDLFPVANLFVGCCKFCHVVHLLLANKRMISLHVVYIFVIGL